MKGYLTPGEIAALRAGAYTWIAQEFASDGFASLKHYAGYAPLERPEDWQSEQQQDGPDSPLGYDGSDDDSTDMRDRGEAPKEGN